MSERETLTFASEAEWLSMREKDITSTEAAALFGVSPYATEYELHMRKAGKLASDFVVNDRMVWGNRLEAAIAHGIAEDYGLIVEPFKVYMRIPALNMGSSFDFKIVGIVPGFEGNDAFRRLFREHGAGIMEVKNVDGLAFKRGWIHSETEAEAPPHIEFQVQHQLEVADLGWSLIAPLVGGNRPMPFARLRDREVGGIIKSKVQAFWKRFDLGDEPDPDFTTDAKVIAAMFSGVEPGSYIDLSDNERLAQCCAEYKQASAEYTALEKRKDALKAEILTIVGDCEKASAAGFKLSCGRTKDSPGTLVTPEMVGTFVGGRAGYRRLTITPI